MARARCSRCEKRRTFSGGVINVGLLLAGNGTLLKWAIEQPICKPCMKELKAAINKWWRDDD